MKVDFIDLSRENKKYSTEVIKSFKRIIDSSDFILGKDVESFEKQFANYIKVKYSIGVASGTDAILLALMALGIRPNDEVIAPAYTFSATISPIMMLNAKPVLVDSLNNSPLIDPSKIEKVITKKTKAIIIVHMYGLVCDMKKIIKIAKKYNLKIIEDCSQAQGGMFELSKVGSLGDIGTFSFYPTKNLGAFGDAGIITTNDTKIYKNLLLLRNHGQRIKNKHEILGTNSRLDTFQAALLLRKLKFLDSQNKKRLIAVNLYKSLLRLLPIQFIEEDNRTKSVYYILPIIVKNRNKLIAFLNAHNIKTGLYYDKPLNLQKFYYSRFGKQRFENAEKLMIHTLALPMYPEIKKTEILYVVKILKKYFKNEEN